MAGRSGKPSGTFADREFALLDTFYASVVEAVLERYFGELSDVDGNGKLLVLLTKEVNKNDDGLAGHVWGGDLFPEDVCATSNQAEIFYGYVPDPGGVFGEPKTREEVLDYYPILLTHEITHIVQFSAQVIGDAGDKARWEIEGGAALAEQLVAYDLFGHSSGQDLGYAQYNQSDESRRWYWNAWLADMFKFFGWDTSGERDRHDYAMHRRSALGSVGKKKVIPGRARGRMSTACPPWCFVSPWIAGEMTSPAAKRH